VRDSAGLDEGMVGRDAQVVAVLGLLAGARERFTALLVEGDEGIGKTTVFQEALRIAGHEDFRVLTCRHGASEAGIAFTAVGDLLDTVSAGELAMLPVPQRRALEVALLRAEPDPDSRSVDQRAIAAGIRSLIVAMAEERPLLVAVDDVQWMDPASVSILEFVLRRLGPQRVGLLVTRLLGQPLRPDLDRLLPREVLARERLGALGVGALEHVLRRQFGDDWPRATLLRIHDASRGNPLFALEIGHALAGRRTISPFEPLPVPNDVRDVVRARVEALPDATRDLLLAASLLAVPSAVTLARAFARPPQADIEPAERGGVASFVDGVVVFAHPLHAAAVIANATTAGRHRMHLRLASAVDDPEARGRHFALGAEEPAEAVAAIVEEGAAAARGKGHLQAAAELLEHARTLTPGPDVVARQRRGVQSAELHMQAGDRARSRALLEELVGAPLGPLLRADVLRLLGELCLVEDDVAQSARLLSGALVLAAPDPRRAARIQRELAYVTTLQMDFRAAAEHARQALAARRELDDRPLLADALAQCAMSDFLAGRGADWSLIDEALALDGPDELELNGMPPAGVAACLMMWAGRHDEARELMRSACGRLRDGGRERDLAQALLWSSWLETRDGNLHAAGLLADEALSYAELTDSDSLARWASAQRAWVDAHVGLAAQARHRVGALSSAGAGAAHVDLWISAALSLADMSVGDCAAAWQATRTLVELVERWGVGEPMVLMPLPDALEAMIGLGDLDRAEVLLADFERRGRQLDRVWALCTAARCRGLLLAARGDLTGAARSLEHALAEHDRMAFPFDRARTLLAFGVVQRRSRRRARARTMLEQAAMEFERMGAHAWAERAHVEIGRIAGRAPRSAGTLTAGERRVADLAIDGLSNKQIAATLYVGVHTVEVHLSNAYTKLGIRSRSQLARALAGSA
jgi:DNA-binding CsgD family transcriptional regulator/tetratricopeptide (TPR) repeat protein